MEDLPLLAIDRLADDVVLRILLQLPELECWAACELVCRGWRALVRDNRTRIAVTVPFSSVDRVSWQLGGADDGDGDGDGPQQKASLLMRALMAAGRSAQPLVELRVNCASSHVTPRFWSNREIKAFTQVVKDAASSLEVLEVTGPAGFFPSASHASGRRREPISESRELDPALEALFEAACESEDRASPLRHMDVSWTDAASGSRIGELLTCCGTMEALRLGGCTTLHELQFHDGVENVKPHLRELLLPSCYSGKVDAPVALFSTSFSSHGGATTVDAPPVDALSQDVRGAFASLTALDLSQVRFTPRGLQEVFRTNPPLCKRLRRLGLAGHTGLPSRMFAHALCVCERLTAVDFSSSLIGDDAIRQAAIDAPSHLAQLAEVDLTECSSITDHGVAELCTAAGPTLRALALGGAFSPLSDEAAIALGKRCSAPLARLTMRAKQLNEGLVALAPIAASLDVLDLCGCDSLQREPLGRVLPRTGPGCGARLRVLRLRSCADAVTDDLLADFLPRAHSLEELDVAYCTKLTDMACVLLASGRARALRKLRRLDVTGCHRFTERGRRQLQGTYPPAVLIGAEDDEEEMGAAMNKLKL